MNFTHTKRLLKKGKLITFAILTNCFIFNINPLEEKYSRDTDFNYCLERALPEIILGNIFLFMEQQE